MKLTRVRGKWRAVRTKWRGGEGSWDGGFYVAEVASALLGPLMVTVGSSLSLSVVENLSLLGKLSPPRSISVHIEEVWVSGLSLSPPFSPDTRCS